MEKIFSNVLFHFLLSSFFLFFSFDSSSSITTSNHVLHIDASTGIDSIGPIKPSLAICLMIVFLVVYFSLWKGVKSTGKAVWITALFPYFVIFVLLIRGTTLDGAADGIRFYLSPKWDRLYSINVNLHMLPSFFHHHKSFETFFTFLFFFFSFIKQTNRYGLMQQHKYFFH